MPEGRRKRRQRSVLESTQTVLFAQEKEQGGGREGCQTHNEETIERKRRGRSGFDAESQSSHNGNA